MTNPSTNTDATDTVRIETLEEECRTLRAELDRAEFRVSDLRNQLKIKDETIKWIYSSRIYRLAKSASVGLDRLLKPVHAVRRALRDDSSPVTPPPVAASPEPTRQVSVPTFPAARAFDIICLPVIDWEFRYQRPQHLMRQFGRDGHRAIYMRTTFHQEGNSVRIDPLGGNVFGAALPGRFGLSIYKDDLSAAHVNNLMNAMDEFRRNESIHDAICIVDLPFWCPLAEAMRERWGWKIVYDCMDEHAGFSTNTSAMVNLEDHMTRTSDLVIATARLLHEKVTRLNDNVLLLPNAAEYEHFESATAVLERTSTPVIGYYGAISDWFDVEMIRKAAAARPNWRFVLIGSTDGINPAPLERMTNVELLGEKPYADLPGFLHSFDVTCIPFLDNELTQATNPVKFFEYLSAGKPVVSIDLNELSGYKDYYYSAPTHADFIPAVERALAEDSPTKIAERQAMAKTQTWDARHAVLHNELIETYGLVSIIVVSYQNPDYMRFCLESLLEKTCYPKFEVIVVDNASDPEVVEYLVSRAETDPRVRLILNEDNHGFAKANNQGIEAATSAEYVVLLNNDTIVVPGWLFGLTRYLRNEQIGMVGPVTSFAGNEARIEVDYDPPTGIDAFAEQYTRDHAGLHFDIDVLAMFCVAIRKSLVQEIGLLDERYGRGMFEDDDYALRVRDAGYRTVCAEDVFVHHWGEGSFGKLERPEYHALFAVNKQKFEEKWQRAWVAHRARDWDQNFPPAERVTMFRVDEWRWSCNLCGHAHTASHERSRGDDLLCANCESNVASRALVRFSHPQSNHGPCLKFGIPRPSARDAVREQ
jgi:GT2 family glycosyltransferase